MTKAESCTKYSRLQREKLSDVQNVRDKCGFDCSSLLLAVRRQHFGSMK